MIARAEHTPVMLSEIVAALAPHKNGLYVDGTFGRGGYSRGLLTAAETQVFGIDRDPDAIAAGQSMVKEFTPRLHLLHGNFGDMDTLLATENVSSVDGITLDLGVSSPQLDQAERGFSFQEDGPLDMRMSKTGTSAADLVNTTDEQSLANIIYQYGDERFSRRIAKKIVATRAVQPFARTRQLVEIVRQVVPRSADGIDPATRTFQALRIAVNDELGELERGLYAAERLLKPKGRLVIVSFHSLEDRCVKDFLRQRSADAPRGSRHTPANDQPAAPSFELITRKPQLPTAQESSINPRARSAKLRIAERTNAPAHRENVA